MNKKPYVQHCGQNKTLVYSWKEPTMGYSNQEYSNSEWTWEEEKEEEREN